MKNAILSLVLIVLVLFAGVVTAQEAVIEPQVVSDPVLAQEILQVMASSTIEIGQAFTIVENNRNNKAITDRLDKVIERLYAITYLLEK